MSLHSYAKRRKRPDKYDKKYLLILVLSQLSGIGSSENNPTGISVSPCMTDKCSVTHNLSAMEPQDRRAEIAALEIQLKRYEYLFDQSIRNNEVLAKTKIILHDIKLVSERLIKLKNNTGLNKPDSNMA